MVVIYDLVVVVVGGVVMSCVMSRCGADTCVSDEVG